MNEDILIPSEPPTYYVIRSLFMASRPYFIAGPKSCDDDILNARRFSSPSDALLYLQDRYELGLIGPLELVRVDTTVTKGTKELVLDSPHAANGELFVIITEQYGKTIVADPRLGDGRGLFVTDVNQALEPYGYWSLDEAVRDLLNFALLRGMSLVGIRRAKLVSTPGSTKRTLTVLK